MGFRLYEGYLNPGKVERLKELMHEHGPAHGRILLLPYDHGLEHGPSDFFPNPDSVDPIYVLELAEGGGLSGVVLHIGLARDYWAPKYRGKVPLVLKLNGKTNIPSDEEAISPLVVSVKEAYNLGASAVGYTLYVGSPKQDEDMGQWTRVREEAEILGMPTIMWSYPRGEYAEIHGGRDSFAMVNYAARVANELGADLTKLNFPKKPTRKIPIVDETGRPVIDREEIELDGQKISVAKTDKYGNPVFKSVTRTDYDPNGPFKAYNKFLELSPEEMLKMVVQSAGRTGVLVAGGEKKEEQEMLDEVEDCLAAGVVGFLIGRNDSNVPMMKLSA